MSDLWIANRTVNDLCSKCGARQQISSSPGTTAAAVAPGYTPYVPVVGGTAHTSKWISEGWDLVKNDLGIFIVMTIVMGAINGAIPLILNGPTTAGFQAAFKRKFRGEKAELGDIFIGFQRFGPTLVANLLISLFAFLGFLFFIIPGLIIVAMYTFTYLFIVDKGMGHREAMRASREIVRQDYFGYIVFMIGLGLLNIAGALCLLVGLLVTIPVSMGAIAAAYRDAGGFTS